MSFISGIISDLLIHSQNKNLGKHRSIKTLEKNQSNSITGLEKLTNANRSSRFTSNRQFP